MSQWHTELSKQSVVPPDHTDISLTPSLDPHRAVRMPDFLFPSEEEAEKETDVELHRSGSVIGRKLVTCYKKST